MDPDDIEMLEDLIVAATNEAFRQMEAESSEAMSKLTGGLGGHWAEVFPSNGLLQQSDYKLIEELSKLPGVGAKSAQRLAFHIINMPKEQVEELAGAMTGTRNNVRYCKECFTLTDKELCPICSSDRRNHKTIMVVENTRDWLLMRKLANTMGFIMCCMEPFLLCWGLAQRI